MSSDLERQQDEILVLQSIFESSEFRSNEKKEESSSIECAFFVNCELQTANETLCIKYRDDQMFVRYLPPIRFYLKLPPDYPSKSAPNYSLAINWLPPWQISLACQKLDELWQENNNSEILYSWSNFLKNELMGFLGVGETLDLTFLYEVYLDPDDEFFLGLLKLSDDRIIYGGLHLNPADKLREHNEVGAQLEFDSSSHDCDICFVPYSGSLCRKLDKCGHVFCQGCIEQYLAMKINERNVNIIRCPAYNCNTIVNSSQIKDVCSLDLFEKYEKYLLEIRQLNTKNLVYCPRSLCRAAVIVKHGDSLASCHNCEYNFCAYCFKGYHGVAACDMNLKEKMKLIEEYNKANNATKKYLETKYGKHQIKQIIERQLTDEYIKENTKVCPTCKVFATKTSGCNLMKCLKCHTNFCWICNNKITSEDPYDHFKTANKSSCVGLLFEGVDEEAEFEDFVQENIAEEDLILIDQILDNDV